VIGQQARVVGELVADEIVIGGEVSGSIRGNNVTFQTASRVEGEVYHRKLAIEQGAYFEGKSRRSEDPTGQYSDHGGQQR
jgi:cytoskeletal protein CcmA (bactofilin family)